MYRKIKSYIGIIIPSSILSFIKKYLINKGVSTFVINPFRIDGPRRIKIGIDGYVGDQSTLSCYGGFLVVGDRFYATQRLNVYCGEKITIGDDVLIGSYVLITDLSHGIDPTSDLNYQKQSITTKSVYIASGCWLGDKVSVLPGTMIGKKCVVGANSVLNGNYPDYSMIAGNPAKVVKRWCFDSHKWIPA